MSLTPPCHPHGCSLTPWNDIELHEVSDLSRFQKKIKERRVFVSLSVVNSTLVWKRRGLGYAIMSRSNQVVSIRRRKLDCIAVYTRDKKRKEGAKRVQTRREDKKTGAAEGRQLMRLCFAVLLAAVMHGWEMWNEVKWGQRWVAGVFRRPTDGRRNNHTTQSNNRLIPERASEMEGEWNVYRNETQNAKPKVIDEQRWKDQSKH